MEIKKTLCCEYCQIGHSYYPEDTWEESAQTDSEKELYEFIVSIHKRDARNHSDYPLYGSVDGTFIFYIKTTKTVFVDGECFEKSEREYVSKPDFFSAAMENYIQLMKRARVLLPFLRAAKIKKQNDESDFKKFQELKQKFE